MTVDWRPMGEVPRDRTILICFYNKENRHKHVMVYGYAGELSDRGLAAAVGWADINLPNQGEEK